MPSNIEIYAPSRIYARFAWAALGCATLAILAGFELGAVYALIPAVLCACAAVALFWLAGRPNIAVGDTQFSIGDRSVSWREVKEINSTRFVSPLVLDVRLTNSRRKWLVYPGAPERIAKLMYQLRRTSVQATFDGVAYNDYWTWNSLGSTPAPGPVPGTPVRMLNPEDEDEVERLYQRLKTVGHLDSRSDSKTDRP